MRTSRRRALLLAVAGSASPVPNAAGWNDGPYATDVLSGVGAASCGPVDTSTLGSFTAARTASDLAGNTTSAAASHDVTATATKGAVLEEIQAALASTSGHDREALGQAVRALTASLDPRQWADPSHPAGKRVFADEAAAVDALAELHRSRRTSIPAAAIQGWIASLVAVDRALAALAFADASSAGGDARKLAEAAKELAKGDSEAGRGRSNAAIEHYGNAWFAARQATVFHDAKGHTGDTKGASGEG